VAERKTRTRSGATRRRSGAATATPDALGRLNDSIESAQAALKDLRGEMSRGSRELLSDVDKTLRDARKNLRRTQRRITKDLDDVQQAARGKRATGTRKTPATQSAARRRSSGRSAKAKS
jgi:predicted  nucleic acid-binding Zn-ribbon protein